MHRLPVPVSAERCSPPRTHTANRLVRADDVNCLQATVQSDVEMSSMCPPARPVSDVLVS